MPKPAGTALPPTSRQVVDALICHLESRVYPSAQLRIAGAGRERCLPDYLIERNGYPCFILEIVARGRGVLSLGERMIPLLPGHLFLYGPGVRFNLRTEPEAPMLKYFIAFFGSTAKRIFHSGIITMGEVRRVSDIDHLAELCEHLIAAGKRKSPRQQAICVAYLELILLKTTEAFVHDQRSSGHLLENLERCRSLIETHFREIANLQALSRMAHLDVSYICRLFKQFKLPSPHRYLNNCRMNRAVELLLTTDQPVKAVAAGVGYADPLHFSRNFHRELGCSPSTFRDTSMNRRAASPPLAGRGQARRRRGQEYP
jgi:AraC-like DNA-binding protein